jgi:ABC-type Zn uptake system ZnuABC Zn-binding protein ZnuA
MISRSCTTSEKVAAPLGETVGSETTESALSTEIKKLNELLEQEKKKTADFQVRTYVLLHHMISYL